MEFNEDVVDVDVLLYSAPLGSIVLCGLRFTSTLTWILISCIITGPSFQLGLQIFGP